MSDGIEPYMSPVSTTAPWLSSRNTYLGVGTADICTHYRLAQDMQQPTLLSALPSDIPPLTLTYTIPKIKSQVPRLGIKTSLSSALNLI